MLIYTFQYNLFKAMDITILITVAALTVVTIVLLLFVKRKLSRVEEKRPVPQPRGNNILPGARRRQPAYSRNVRQRNAREDPEEEDEGEGAPLDINLPDGKVGAKKLAKLQAKAEKKAHREAEDRDRQEKKKKQEIEDEDRRKVEEREKAEEKKKEDEERKIREEKERQEHDEYLKMKEAFSVESEGYEEGEVEGGNALQDFVSHIKNNKVVVIEDIAAQFKLKTQQAIDRIQNLEADGILTGVIDDRGKFIYISNEELESVAKFVKQRGRVSIAELVDNSNMLIDLTPRLTL